MRRAFFISVCCSVMAALLAHGQGVRKVDPFAQDLLPDAPIQQDVPAKKALDDAEKIVKQLFKSEYAKTKASDRAELAKRLFDEAKRNQADLASHYVLLRESRDLAAKAGEITLFASAADGLSKMFRLSRAAAGAGSIETLAANAVKGTESAQGLRTLIDAADDGVGDGDYIDAAKMLAGLETIARKLKAPDLAVVQGRIKTLPAIVKEFVGLGAARKLLLQNQSDPKANGLVGRHDCFVKGEWDLGLSHLAMGNDDKLKEMAGNDIGAALKGSQEQFSVAEAWREVAGGFDSLQKSRIEGRALHWYREALKDAMGLRKALIEQRIQELAKSASPAASSASAPAMKTDDPPIGKTMTAPASGGALSGFAYRTGPARAKLVDEWGGTKQSEEAVARGLKWLARVQSADGRWKLDGNFPDKGSANDAGATGLGLLPFLGHGITHVPGAGPDAAKDAATVRKALDYLKGVQDKRTGNFSRDTYAHAICTIAICEAFVMTKDYALKKPAQKAIDYLVAGQHSAGGWRYQPGQAGDTSVTSWVVTALKTGLAGELDVPAATLKKATNYLDTVLDQSTEGYGYIGTQATPSMSAAALLCRQHLQDWDSSNLRLVKGVDNHLKPNYPKVDRKDVYYYYYASQVMHHFGGTDWKAWNEKMRDNLVKMQDKDETKPATYGSWSPQGDTWGRTGGRLMQTSLSILTLEVYYRHVSLAAAKK